MNAQDNQTAVGFSSEDQELLSFFLEDEGLDFQLHKPIPQRERRDRAPLSYAQQRLWFLDQWQSASPVYNCTSAVRLQGNLNLEALERTLREILRRHESLRTTFAIEETQPVQIIHETETLSLDLIDLTKLPEADREEEAQRLATIEVRRPFDLSRGPLLRVNLLRLNEKEHIAVLVVHHIISDAWSMNVLLGELTTLYQAFATGKASPLPELPIQYADYAVWQRESLQGDNLKSQLAYWREHLAGMTNILELPADRPRPPLQSFRGAKQAFLLPSSISNELKALSLRTGATLFMTLLAAFLIFLARYTGQTDLAVGTPIAGRKRFELEGLIGFFINTLLMRTDLSGDPSFIELLGRVKTVALEAYDHQDVPFEKLVDELQPQRNLSHQPLFDVMFMLRNTPSHGLHQPGLTVSYYAVENETSRFDLTLSMVVGPQGLAGTLEYNTDLFAAETAARMLRNFETLLTSIVDNPQQRISQLSLLRNDEKHQLLSEWNASKPEKIRDMCLHRLFEEQVERTPDGVALSYENERLTYAELNRRANQVAHNLRKRGVAAESLVGICVERSINLVVGLLGIMKAGGAYVPLDPNYPRERLSFILSNAQIKILVTQSSLVQELSGLTAEVLCLDSDEIKQESEQNTVEASELQNLAYVIYTSGSTGRPKGVAVTHANVIRLFAATQAWYSFNEQDVWTLFHSYTFDFSVWELWGALLHGGRLVIVPFLVSRTPEAFYQLLVKEGVTVLNQTPSAFGQLMRVEETYGDEEKSLALRLIIFGGEALELRNLQRWYERHSECQPQLVNMYGITETTVHVTYRPLRAADAHECPGSMIGCCIPDLQACILDKHMQPVPIGVPGELYVGGDGLARGYLGHATLTAERFGPHPFSTTPGARLYRTGDRARYLSDGDIEYLGRADEQVKIRGFRIELGEIETVLGQYEAVNEVAVVAREDVLGERRLVAYIVTAETHAITTKLRHYLQERLPEYMIPSAFIPISQLPMTPHGKLDRRALPVPGVERPEMEKAYAAPRNEVEETLATIWANALGVERVGIHDNFFELGGDSILSVRVLAMAKDRGINFSLQQLFQSQTIGALAEQLNLSEIEAAPAQSGGPFSLLKEADHAKLPDDVEDAYPLAMLQAGMLYHMVYSPAAMIYHNVYSYHLRARLEIDALRQAVQNVVDRHAILRTSFDLSAYSEPLQLVHRNTTFPVEVDDLRQVAIEEQESVLDEFVESEKLRRFDYSRPPLLRFHIHRRTEDSFNFTLTECHPILDGWSLHSILAEIFTSYFDALNGRSTPAPPLSSYYREFVRRERLALASEECQQYWHEKLRNMRATELPRWRSTSAKTGQPRILKRNYPLSVETSKGLKTLARSLSVPLKSVLLAAHLKALSVICGRGDVVTGLVSTGRLEETDGDKTIGLFFNTLPFHANMSGGSWRDLIAATFKAELELLPYRRYPIAALQNQWGRKPLFETVFNYLHFHVMDDLVRSGDLEMLGPIRSWEETNLTLSTAFVRPPLSEQIILNLRFDTTQFSDDQIESISGYYTRIIDLMLSDPYGRHEGQSFLAADEMQKLLKEWNTTPANHSDERCIHQLFEAQAGKTPDTVAVICEGERLTYRELNEQANRLARHLLARGIGPEVRVAICLERSVGTIVCILGVLKAGGAYVFIEPEQAPQRIAVLLEEAAVPLLLTHSKLIASLPVNQVKVVCVDAGWEDGPQKDEPNCIDNVSSGTLAYLMFTSGSTGRPKAVAVEHRQLVNYVRGISERLQLSGIANYALASTFATDLGHTAIFPPLMMGGTLHVLSSERLANPTAFAEYFELHCIDCLKIVPTHLAALLGSLPDRKILPRRRLILGGDVCRRDLVERVNSLAPDCVVFNHYGPTETTVGALTYGFEPKHKADLADTVPLGHPLPGAEIYLLDVCMNPVPTGTPGELYIGGQGVARGYFNQPGLTAERFIPNSFTNEPGTRLYKTGDMGRYLPDGNVEFLGRHDHQVKIRGYRIELGEVEAILCQHPAISQAVAMIDRKEQEYDSRILAYVVTNTGPAPTQSELRRHMRERLPDYSVPSVFVLLHELPLTASGKIDRKALPQATSVALESEVSYVAPRDETEQIIAAIWRDLLKVERMSVHDNFFDLGGHSLVVLQAQSKLREMLQKDIPIVAMFEYPTISSLANYLNTVASEEKPFAKAQEEAAARRAMLTERSRLNTNAMTHP